MSAVFNADKKQPFAQWEEVDVTFPSSANTDIEVPHTLMPTDPEAINYIVLRKDRAGDVYHNTAYNRKPWQSTYILLRCTVASAQMKLLLYVSHSR